MRPISISRLELQAATLSVDELMNEISKIIFWSILR